MPYDIQRLDEASLHTCFVTPILSYQWPDSWELNQRLRQLFLEEERVSKTADKTYSNVGGWHSELNMHERGHEDIQQIVARVRSMVMEVTRITLDMPFDKWKLSYEINLWANVNRSGDYNMLHAHSCSWAVVYYVAVGEHATEDPRGGAMELMDPRPAATMVYTPGKFFSHRYFIHPSPGLMVLFPGWLTHFVNPFFGKGERISMACNINVTDCEFV